MEKVSQSARGLIELKKKVLLLSPQKLIALDGMQIELITEARVKAKSVAGLQPGFPDLEREGAEYVSPCQSSEQAPGPGVTGDEKTKVWL